MYDLIIVGGGPAGLTAGIYAVRFGLNTLILERSEISGQIALADIVENYPGFPSISGLELMENYKKHAQEVGVETKITEVLSVRTEGDKKIVSTDGGDLESKAVIIATGANPKPLNVPGEKEFISKGVSYCATCDGPFFKNKTVVIVGGGNSAVTDALFLSKIARKVYLIHRRDQLRAAKVLKDRAFATPNIEFIFNTLVLEIIGSSGEIRRVEKVIIKNLKSGEQRELATDGVFIYVGIHPNTEIIDVDKDEEGFIKTDRFLETSQKGIYAAGDCRDTPIWQLVAAVRDGALAATSANAYIESLKKDVT
ncbi:thioredoxin reductase (NADPH) [Methanosarcina thermophila]|jgi:thioredoxin reductase (NADPH)|uniref:Thioredoxin reductase n=3 Tax=Methanosarcina thermophila TaxID=2210 RepID=A0A1I6Y5K8_METTE|nr:thioredoxin-disulfide reductase [Methanosarcina thermophila]ALK05871.1 MAG: thioredoxin reductase [Methanosarcina sp. 795]AKB12609.1 Thioredoxin reductase [Methanosarcina thermophila TM-1]AKB16738.1 Thioredoxin reductase [Methanosarcina thermophila CHTI-55]NLU56665.1 thioredoxin-disulfide reductase [Methanosarcina thermophila]SFT45414.1 thioredoxin reductase (NADPH) [Methanosarcina thermophila]